MIVILMIILLMGCNRISQNTIWDNLNFIQDISLYTLDNSESSFITLYAYDEENNLPEYSSSNVNITLVSTDNEEFYCNYDDIQWDKCELVLLDAISIKVKLPNPPKNNTVINKILFEADDKS